MYAKFPCDIVASGNYTSPISSATNSQWAIFQRWIIAHFDSCIETVHINVDDLSLFMVCVCGHGSQLVELALILIGQRNICQMHVDP